MSQEGDAWLIFPDRPNVVLLKQLRSVSTIRSRKSVPDGQMLNIKYDYIDWLPEPCLIYIFEQFPSRLALMETNCGYVLLHAWILANQSFLKGLLLFFVCFIYWTGSDKKAQDAFDKGKYCHDPCLLGTFWLSVEVWTCASFHLLKPRVHLTFMYGRNVRAGCEKQCETKYCTLLHISFSSGWLYAPKYIYLKKKTNNVPNWHLPDTCGS